jgi:hypothetical protein
LAFLLATLLFSDAHAQETLEILSPQAFDDIPTAFKKDVTVQWLDGGDPVRGSVTLKTSLGAVVNETVKTDDFGQATFFVTSIEAGDANLEATAGSASTSISINFKTPNPNNPRDPLNKVEPVQPPFDGNGVLRRDEKENTLWLAKDRIGFIVGANFKRSDLDNFISNNNVVEIIVLDERMLSLRFDDDARVKPLRQFARELESIGGALLETERPIRRAGLVAWLDGTDQAYIAPDTIIVKFKTVPDSAVQATFKNRYKLSSMVQLGRNPSRFVAEVDISQVNDPITLATEIARNPLIDIVDPNFIVPRSRRSVVETTPGFDLQWYHQNLGTSAQEDADIDTERAWEYTEGTHDVMIAVLDSGFDIEHPDLIDNLDPVDPTNFAIDLNDLDNSDLYHDNYSMESFGHGTRAAGVAAARGDNDKGYAGVCPSCQLLLIRMLTDNVTAIAAIDAAVDRGAKIISGSWGWPPPHDQLLDVMNEAVADGVTIFMAMTNEEVDNCGDTGEIDTSSPHSVIAVSGSTDYDKRSLYAWEGLGYGKCMDVLAPTRGGEKGIHTTSVEMTVDGPLSTYWHDFSGTSASTPMAAGVAGLLLTLDDTLEPLEIQRILQDTADRIDPENANYSIVSGFDDPGGTPKYGYGRINAYEAARLVAVPALGGDRPGKGGQDLLLRDHRYDWGNTEQPSNTLFNSPRTQSVANRSVDIKIDVDPIGPTLTTSAEFDEFVSEQLEAGKPARVYVRTRNRGPSTVSGAILKLHATVVDDELPDLPADFWDKFPNDSAASNEWITVDSKTLISVPYSGASLAGCPGREVPRCHPWAGGMAPKPTDEAIITDFDLPGLDWDRDVGEYIALLAAVHAAGDPLQAKAVPDPSFSDVLTAVRMDNNVTLWVSHRKYVLPKWLIIIVVLVIAASL